MHDDTNRNDTKNHFGVTVSLPNTNNVGNIGGQNNLNYSSIQKKIVDNHGVYIANNDSFTINVTIK